MASAQLLSPPPSPEIQPIHPPQIELPLLSPPVVALPPFVASTPAPAPRSVITVLNELCDSEPHRLQLKLWQKEEKTMRWRLERKEINRSTTQNEIYQLFGLYFVFQGVVFTALAQSNILSCENWWSPFSLSLVASLATILAIHHKLSMSARFEKDLLQVKRQADVLFNKVDEIRMKGKEYDLNDLKAEPRVQKIEGFESYSNFLSKVLCEYILTYGCAVTVTLLLFSSVILVSCHSILCRGCNCKHQ